MSRESATAQWAGRQKLQGPSGRNRGLGANANVYGGPAPRRHTGGFMTPATRNPRPRLHDFWSRNGAEVLAEIIDELPTPLLCLFENEKEVVANAAARDLFGIPASAAQAVLATVSPAGIPFRPEEFIAGDRPIGDLQIGDRRFACSARPVASRDRPGVLWTFHDVTAQRAAEQERARAKRTAALAQVSRSVVHDLNNLLARIICLAENLQVPGAAPEVETGAEALITEVEDGAELLRRMAAYADTSIATLEAADLGGLIARWREAQSADEPTLITNVAGGRVMVDEDLFRAVLDELAANARQAGATQLVISQVPSSTTDAVLIQIEDDGPGMSSEMLATAAAPFFTSRPTGEAYGLGLAMARNLMARFGGALTLSSPPGKGLTATLHLRSAPTAQLSTPE